MLSTLLSLLKSTLGRYTLVALLALVAGGVLYRTCGPAKVVTITHEGTTTTIVKPGDTVTVHDTKYVTDPATKKALDEALKQNAALKDQIAIAQATISTLQSTGSGTITYVDRPVPGETRVVREAAFKDWRLTFNAQDDKANYTLDQKFETVVTAGRDVKGLPTASVRVSEVGPGETRTPLTNTKTTVIIAAPTGAKHLFVGFNVQAGAAFTHGAVTPAVPATSTTPATPAVPANLAGAIVGVRWLSVGYTKAAEDSVYAFATPVVFLSTQKQEIGILPVSVNLGRIPKQPLKDLWLAPIVTFSPGKLSSPRIGFSIFATF